MSDPNDFVGLNLNAYKFLDLHGSKVTVTTTIESKTHRTNVVTVQSSSKDILEKPPLPESKFRYHKLGDSLDKPTGKLSAYVLKDGRIVHEKVQGMPNGTDPLVRTALAWANGDFIPETLWPDILCS